MKKLSSLLTGIMIAGALSAQQTDTMPANSNEQPKMPADTVPQKNWNNHNSSNMNSNSSKWADSTNRSNSGTGMDSSATQRKTWESGDSTATQNSNNANGTTGNNNSSSTTTDASSTATTSTLSDRVMMRDGAMFIIKNGVESKMTEDVTLSTGGKVGADGTVTMSSGKTVKLKDGQYIELKAPEDNNSSTDADKSTKKGTTKKPTGKQKPMGKKKTTDQ